MRAGWGPRPSPRGRDAIGITSARCHVVISCPIAAVTTKSRQQRVRSRRRTSRLVDRRAARRHRWSTIAVAGRHAADETRSTMKSPLRLLHRDAPARRWRLPPHAAIAAGTRPVAEHDMAPGRRAHVSLLDRGVPAWRRTVPGVRPRAVRVVRFRRGRPHEPDHQRVAPRQRLVGLELRPCADREKTSSPLLGEHALTSGAEQLRRAHDDSHPRAKGQHRPCGRSSAYCSTSCARGR